MDTTGCLIGEDAPLTKLPQQFPTQIDENLALGLDLGVGSCGQALVYNDPGDKSDLFENGKIGGKRRYLKNLPDFPHRIAFLGVRAFDVPETKEKTGIKLKNPERRQKRGLRRTTRRRAWRMWQVRKLLKKHVILPDDYPLDEDLWKRNPPRGEHPTLDKWRDWHSQMTEGPGGDKGKPGPLKLRVKGLDEKLEPLDLASALLHLAKHRGFKSNRKSEAIDSEGGKVLKALSAHAERRAQCDARTHGEMLLKHPDFAERKRNREGVYTATALRKAQEKEVSLIFKRQREFGNTLASAELEKAYLALFNEQKPLQNPLKLLGDCPFEKGEKRGPRLAPAFELSRSLQKLNTLSVIAPGGGKVQFADYVNASNGCYDRFISVFASLGTKSVPGRITWKDLRKIFQLPDELTFTDLPTPKRSTKKDGTEKIDSIDDLEKEDFVTRSNSNGAAKGSYLLRNAIGAELYDELATDSPEQLDHAAFALTFFEQIENDYDQPEYWGVLNQMRHDKLDTRLIAAVEKDLHSDKPTLAKFSGTTSMSTLASRKLIPLLLDGTFYSDACTEIYGDHRQIDFSFDSITNPVVKSVVREVMKQVVHLITETGKFPGRIVVEIGRDLGKSVDERNKMHSGIKDRTKNKNANRKNIANALGRQPDADELLRYELWLEQSNTCPYCREALCGDLGKIANSPEFEIDHILPRSRSHDNSYENKVLVHRKCNRDKSNATPFEFSQIGNSDEQSEGWLRYTATIASIKGIRKQKRRNLLNTTFAKDEAKFAARHLNDTRYISKLVTHYLHILYQIADEIPVTEKGGTKRVFVQPGPMTSLVRKAWGLENLKKDRNGRRLGDKHHAVDALVCALLSESQRQFITLVEQKKYDEAHRALSGTRFVREYQLMEQKNDHCRTPRGVKPPWETFRHDVVEALDLFTVSRRENRRGRGVPA